MWDLEDMLETKESKVKELQSEKRELQSRAIIAEDRQKNAEDRHKEISARFTEQKEKLGFQKTLNTRLKKRLDLVTQEMENALFENEPKRSYKGDKNEAG